MSNSLITKDRKYVWHPFTRQKQMPDPIAIVKGKDSLLMDAEGNAYIDAISSWWVNLHGHAHPYIAEKIYAQAVLQEGFVRVFRFLHQYRQEGDLGAWIRRIMVNTALSFLKKHRNYQQELVFIEDKQDLHAVAADNVEVKLRADDLAKLIRQLPIGYQTIFNLHAVEGYTHPEIGKMLGIEEGTSRSQYARARKLLMQWIQQSDNENRRSYAQ